MISMLYILIRAFSKTLCLVVRVGIILEEKWFIYRIDLQFHFAVMIQVDLKAVNSP